MLNIFPVGFLLGRRNLHELVEPLDNVALGLGTPLSGILAGVGGALDAKVYLSALGGEGAPVVEVAVGVVELVFSVELRDFHDSAPVLLHDLEVGLGGEVAAGVAIGIAAVVGVAVAMGRAEAVVVGLVVSVHLRLEAGHPGQLDEVVNRLEMPDVLHVDHPLPLLRPLGVHHLILVDLEKGIRVRLEPVHLVQLVLEVEGGLKLVLGLGVGEDEVGELLHRLLLLQAQPHQGGLPLPELYLLDVVRVALLGVAVEVAPELGVAEVPLVVLLEDGHEVLHPFDQGRPLADEVVHFPLVEIPLYYFGVKVVDELPQEGRVPLDEVLVLGEALDDVFDPEEILLEVVEGGLVGKLAEEVLEGLLLVDDRHLLRDHPGVHHRRQKRGDHLGPVGVLLEDQEQSFVPDLLLPRVVLKDGEAFVDVEQELGELDVQLLLQQHKGQLHLRGLVGVEQGEGETPRPELQTF